MGKLDGGKMNIELANSLHEKYKGIIAEDMYFECNDGWYQLIDNLFHILTSHAVNAQLDDNFKVVTVKEKFGGLRVYYTASFSSGIYNGDDFVSGAIAMAERISYNICDMCGAPGEVRVKSSWLKTRCDNHA